MVVKQEERIQHAAHTGEENTYENIAEKKLRRTMLEYLLEKQTVKKLTGLKRPRMASNCGFYTHSNKL
jgi:hypothetical protein